MYLVRASETYTILCGDLRVLVAGRKTTVRSPSMVDGNLVYWQHHCSCRQTKDLADTPERDVIVVADMLPVAGRIFGAEDSRSTAIYAMEAKISDVPCFSGVIEPPHALPCPFDSATAGDFLLRQGQLKQRT